ncbi:YraN family protein [Paenibacillus tarimensis]|uniref:YraN family protein n=1 Tax=Paenibacillus tarimensis TaxID=416012 RepID=UPI001F46E2A6|nr:YraN family protein [Paenibacillus tarimensis]MCF2942289.1 YraN family protein [Paenibacillus tarimensis]
MSSSGMDRNAPNGRGKELSRRKETGSRGEDAAAELLVGKGYKILSRNWRCRSGELDIVADDSGTTVFVEVRTRRSGSRYGTAAESVDWRKQRKLHQLAQFYMAVHGSAVSLAMRFDVIAVSYEEADGPLVCTHYEHAF